MAENFQNTEALLRQTQAADEAHDLLPSAAQNIKHWLNENFLPSWALQALHELFEAKHYEELSNRFFRELHFGTGGMRGGCIPKQSTRAETGQLSPQGTPEHAAIGSNMLNDFNILRATIGLFQYCQNHLASQKTSRVPQLVIAYDTRHFSAHFAELTASAWKQLGGEAFLFKAPRSSPQLSFSIRKLKATAGVSITASHNPPSDNGYKVYFEDGAQMVNEHAEGIMESIAQTPCSRTVNFLEKNLKGIHILSQEFDEAYQQALLGNLLQARLFNSDKPLKAVFTPLHGTGAVATLPLLRSCKVEVLEVPEQHRPDPDFSTVKSPNPEDPKALELALELARRKGADIVLATDPDADRMAFAAPDAKNQWEQFSGNSIGAMLLDYRLSQLKVQKRLPKEGSPNAVVLKSFVTTPLMERIAKSHGVSCIDTPTGFKWIGHKLSNYEKKLPEKECASVDEASRAETFLKHSKYFIFGAEESCGYLAVPHTHDKDGNAACLMACELAAWLKSQNSNFSDELNRLYLQHGYHCESLADLRLEGSEGQNKMDALLKSYAEIPPKKVGAFELMGSRNFNDANLMDAEGEALPKEAFFIFELQNNYRVAVRASGTEPKLKFYSFAREVAESRAALESTKAKTQEKIKAMEAAFKEDALQRMN